MLLVTGALLLVIVVVTVELPLFVLPFPKEMPELVTCVVEPIAPLGWSSLAPVKVEKTKYRVG